MGDPEDQKALVYLMMFVAVSLAALIVRCA